MKKILFHLFLLALFFMAACIDVKGGPYYFVFDKDQQNQKAELAALAALHPDSLLALGPLR